MSQCTLQQASESANMESSLNNLFGSSASPANKGSTRHFFWCGSIFAVSKGMKRCFCNLLCLWNWGCHDRHIVSELLHLAKQIDLPTAQKLFQATKVLPSSWSLRNTSQWWIDAMSATWEWRMEHLFKEIDFWKTIICSMLSGKLCRQSSALYLKRVRLDSADRVDEDAWIFQTIRHVEVPTNRSCVQWSQHSFQQTDFPLSQLSSQDLFAWKRFEQTPMLFYPSLKEQVWYGEEDFSKNYHLWAVNELPKVLSETDTQGIQQVPLWGLSTAFGSRAAEFCQDQGWVPEILRASRGQTLSFGGGAFEDKIGGTAEQCTHSGVLVAMLGVAPMSSLFVQG